MISYFKILTELVSNGYPLAFFTGLVEKFKNKNLQKHYKFHAWHLLPVHHRLYALIIARFINSYRQENPKIIAEVGCGLGGILSLISVGEKYGYDLEMQVIKAAQARFQNNPKMHFEQGSFEKLLQFTVIDFLITVNFIHDLNPETLKEKYLKVLDQVHINYILADEVQGAGYPYHHSLAEILPKNWELIERKKMNDIRDLVFFRRSDYKVSDEC